MYLIDLDIFTFQELWAFFTSYCSFWLNLSRGVSTLRLTLKAFITHLSSKTVSQPPPERSPCLSSSTTSSYLWWEATPIRKTTYVWNCGGLTSNVTFWGYIAKQSKMALHSIKAHSHISYFDLKCHNKRIFSSQFQGRDLSIAYGLVTATYVVIGVAFYLTFPLAKTCIQDVSSSNMLLLCWNIILWCKD